MDDPRDRQAAFNTASRDQWDGFADHRARVSALLSGGGDSGTTRLCVLGAGNANDLDLPALLRAHRAVHLVDLDPAALARGVARQGLAGRAGLRCFGGVDLTGRLDAIAAWSPTQPIPPAELAALAEWPAARVARALAGPYDLVASTCLLSQLIGNAFPALGRSHPQFAAAVDAIRVGHLRLLVQLTAPGGAAVLITDVVSTDTFPALAALPDSALSAQLPRLAREGNFIHGVHPDGLVNLLRRDRVLTTRVTRWQPLEPWRWQLHARVYLVWAVRIEVGPQPLSPRGTHLG